MGFYFISLFARTGSHSSNAPSHFILLKVLWCALNHSVLLISQYIN